MVGAPIQKIVISNVFGSFNRGDALLLEALHDSIRETYGADVHIEGIAHFPELEREHLPDVIWHRPPGRTYAKNGLRRKLENGYRTAVILAYVAMGAPRWFPPLAPREQMSGIRAIRDADLVISSAGGFLIDTNLSIVGNLLQLAAAVRFGRPIVLAPQTIGPIRRPWVRAIARYVLNRCTVVCSREEYSYRYLVDLGVPPAKLRKLTDLALYHRRVDPEAGASALEECGILPGERFLGASVVNWSFPRSSDARESKVRYLDNLCRVIQTVHSQFGLRTLIVNQVSSDLELAREVGRRLGPAVVIDEKDRTPAEMRGIITRSAAFFGSRFHSCVFALLERVPTVSLAYSYKSTGIMETLGLGDRVFDIDAFEPETVLAILEAQLADPGPERARIEKAITGLQFPTFSQVLREVT